MSRHTAAPWVPGTGCAGLSTKRLRGFAAPSVADSVSAMYSLSTSANTLSSAAREGNLGALLAAASHAEALAGGCGCSRSGLFTHAGRALSQSSLDLYCVPAGCSNTERRAVR